MQAKNKVIPRVMGGLGNQLFSYAAARRLALVNNAELVIDQESGFAHDHVYERHYQLDHFNIPCRMANRKEKLEPFSRIRRYLMRKVSQRQAFGKRRYIQQEGVDFDERLLTLKVKGVVHLEGYWQSEKYFKDVEEQIRLDLQITPPADPENTQMAARIRACNAVAVHVRYFDEPAVQNTDNAPGDYYVRAIETMETLVPNAHYFVFSDRPKDARQRIALPYDRITLVTGNEGDENAYADMWLMSLCSHFIIANSTFSWWGAWLAESRHKNVIAPGFEKRHGKMWWGFDGLLPDEWIKL